MGKSLVFRFRFSQQETNPLNTGIQQEWPEHPGFKYFHGTFPYKPTILGVPPWPWQPPYLDLLLNFEHEMYAGCTPHRWS